MKELEHGHIQVTFMCWLHWHLRGDLDDIARAHCTSKVVAGVVGVLSKRETTADRVVKSERNAAGSRGRAVNGPVEDDVVNSQVVEEVKQDDGALVGDTLVVAGVRRESDIGGTLLNATDLEVDDLVGVEVGDVSRSADVESLVIDRRSDISVRENGAGLNEATDLQSSNESSCVTHLECLT